MGEFYTVKPNDTLYGISKETGIPLDSLCKYNNLNKDAILSINTKLRLSMPNNIDMYREISDSEIERQKYIEVRKNENYKVKNGDNLSTIANKFNVEVGLLMQLNGLNENSVLKINQELKIPPTRTVKNINNLNDVAKAMGVSQEFIKNLKQLEDGLKENEFHNTPYIDATGHKTIGIGHVWKSGEKEKLSNKEVLTLFAQDLIKMEDNISVCLGGRKKYDELPQSMKEALLDMVFNKGTNILSPDLLYRLKNGKYEAAINTMTNNKSISGLELSGLSKRRLFDISTACKMYGKDIPASNIATAQQVYNRGVELLRKESKTQNNFENLIVGYNEYVQKYFGDKIKLTTK